MTTHLVSLIFGQQIELDILQCKVLTPFAERLVKIAIVVGSLLIAFCSYQIVVGIDTTTACLRIVCLQKALINLLSFLLFMQALQCHSSHNLYLALILVKVVFTGIMYQAIVAQQILGTVNPIERS